MKIFLYLYLIICIFCFLIISPIYINAAESITSGPTNTPDPFNWGAGPVPAATTINIETTKATDLRIEIYNKPPDTSELIRRFYSDIMSSTTLSTTWLGTDDNGTELTNGTYTGKFKLKLSLSLQITIEGSGVVFNNPSDVAVDSTGNVYVINKGNRTVQKFSSGGILLLFDFQVTSFSNQPEGIAVDSSGNIYVANTHYGTIEKYNSSGNLISSNWASNLNQPTGMASDSSNIYIADEGDDVIYKVSISSGGAVSVAASPGAGNDYFYDPKDVDIDSNGNFYIGGRGRFTRFYLFKHNSNGTYNSRVLLDGSNLDPGFISGVSVDAQDNIYVVSSGDSGQIPIQHPFIEKYDTNLNQQGVSFGSYGSGNNEFADPLGIGVIYNSSTGKTYVYVADAGNSRIQKIGETNNTFSYISSIQEDENNVLSPNDVAVDSSGNVYVVCEKNNKVKVFNSSGVYQYSIAEYGLANGEVNAPKGVTVDSAGKVYISDRGRWDMRGRVQVFTNEVYESGLIGAGNNQYLSGLGVDVSDNVYTAWGNNGNVYRNSAAWIDVGNSAEDVCIDYKTNAYIGSAFDGRIYRYSYGGVSLGNVTTSGTPHIGIAVDLFGDIYCATSLGIERYNNDLSTCLGVYLGTELDNVQGIAFSPDYQYLWVADKDNNYLKKYKLEWDDIQQDSMTIQDTNSAPTVNNVVLSGNFVNEVEGEYYARNGNVTFTITFSENMNTSSNIIAKYVVNAHEYFITKTSFIGNTWIGTCTIASNDDGTAVINIRDGYDTGNTLMDPNPNIDFNFNIDTIPPAAPTVSQPGTPTSESVIQVNGSAEQNIYVHVYNNSQATGGSNISYQSNINVNGDGDWTANSIDLLTANPPKSNWIWAIAVDKAGNISSPSSPRKLVLYVDPSAGSGYITPSDDVYLGKTFGEPWSIYYTVNSYMSNGTMTVEIPYGWADPSTNNNSPGYAYIKSVTSMSLEVTNALICSNHLIKLSFENAVPGAEAVISYGNTNFLAVSNYAKIGINFFVMRAENNNPDHDWYPDDTIVPQSADQSLDITVLGEDMKIGYSSSMPTNVYKGESSITAMTLFMQNDNGGTNHDEVTVLKITTEDSNNNAINADTALSRIIVTDGTNTYKNLTSIPASSLINIDMTGFPITILAGTTKKIFLVIDIDVNVSAKSIQLNLNSSSDVVARDKESQISIGVTTNTGYAFPMRTSFAVIYSNAPALQVNAGLVNNMPSFVEKAQTNVLSAKIFFSSTNSGVNDIKITELNLFVEDKKAAGIIPSSVLTKVVIQKAGGGTIYLEDTTMESSGSNIFLDLSSNPVFVPNLTSVTVDVKVGISISCYATNFQLNLNSTNSITAKDKLLNTDISIDPASGYSFPMRTGNAVIATKFIIVHDNSALISQWEPVIIKVCNTNRGIITNYTGTITLDTDGTATTIKWTNNYSYGGTFTDGGLLSDTAVYQFALADNGVITLSIMDTTVESINISVHDEWIQDEDIEGYLDFQAGSPVINLSKEVMPPNARRPYEVLTYTIRYSNTTSFIASDFYVVESLPVTLIILTNSSENSNSPHAGTVSIYYATNYDGTNWFDSSYDTTNTIRIIKRIKWVMNSSVGTSDNGSVKFKAIIK